MIERSDQILEQLDEIVNIIIGNVPIEATVNNPLTLPEAATQVFYVDGTKEIDLMIEQLILIEKRCYNIREILGTERKKRVYKAKRR